MNLKNEELRKIADILNDMQSNIRTMQLEVNELSQILRKNKENKETKEIDEDEEK